MTETRSSKPSPRKGARAAVPGRPRSFDETEALANAMEAFWAAGYGATTYADLEAATGLRRQSLIYAFGDKQAMFEKALALYAQRRVEESVRRLDAAGAPLENVRAVFEGWRRDAENDRRRGCLMVNTAGEFGAREPAIAARYAAASERLVRAFERCFARARAEGALRSDADPKSLARLAVAAGDGALLQARALSDARQATEAFEAFLSLLTQPSPAV